MTIESNLNSDILNLIEEELFQDNIDTEIKGDSIVWIDNFGAENKIDINQTAINGKMIAWWQQNEVGKDLVRIKTKNNIIINWRPPINTLGLGSGGSIYMKFYHDILILKYRDKHRERTFKIHISEILEEEL